MTSEYDIGDLIELEGDFTDPNTGEPADPDTVVCTVVAPDRTTISTPEVTRVSAGKYTAAMTPAQSGTWWYAFDGTGGAQASGEKGFHVRKQEVPR